MYSKARRSINSFAPLDPLNTKPKLFQINRIKMSRASFSSQKVLKSHKKDPKNNFFAAGFESGIFRICFESLHMFGKDNLYDPMVLSAALATIQKSRTQTAAPSRHTHARRRGSRERAKHTTR